MALTYVGYDSVSGKQFWYNTVTGEREQLDRIPTQADLVATNKAVTLVGQDPATGLYTYSVKGTSQTFASQAAIPTTTVNVTTEASVAEAVATMKASPVTSNTPTVTNLTSNPTPVTTYATNPSGKSGPNTQRFDDGSVIQTFADGSTKTIATDGTITATASTDGSKTSQSGADAITGFKDSVSTAQTNVDFAKQTAIDANVALDTAKSNTAAAEQALADAQASGDPNAVDDAQLQLEAAQAEEDKATETFFAAESDASTAQNELDSAQTNYDTATNAGLDADGIPIVNDPPAEDNGGSIDEGARYQAEIDKTQAETATPVDGNRSGVPFGATAAASSGAQAQWSGAKDLRVKLRVPNEYLVGPATGPGNIIQKNGGILFPYTPQITMDNKADYAGQSPLHSNYAQYFYKNSSVGPIQITAKFTVQNEFEGAVLLGIIHLLRGLTKMKWGNDPDAGSPPPVCRFDAYGDYMLYNVPVSVASWRHDLPENVDYISVGRKGSPTTYGHSMVPVLSTIQLTLNVMYSRREMLNYNVKDWRSGALKYRGYL
jgi:hypothetical protein